MATRQLFSEERNEFFTFTAELEQSYIDGTFGDTPFDYDFYIKISTNFTDPYGNAMEEFVVRTLTDLPPGDAGPYTSFDALIVAYSAYYLAQGADYQSSSSSSSSSSNSSSSSSSSSSEQYSSSSSSSSEGNSSSSSSSEDYSESSSSSSSS